MRTLGEYATEWAHLGPDAFRARHNYAVLIYRRDKEEDENPAMFQTINGPQQNRLSAPGMAFGGLVSRTIPLRLPGKLLGATLLIVYPITKRPEGVFQDRISIGRTRNTDICIPSAKVSKLHAHIKSLGSGHAIFDAGSTNGTFVNGNRLEPEKSHGLKDEDLVQFGSLPLYYYSAEAFFRLLNRR